MKLSRIALGLYFVSVFLAVLASLLNNFTLALFAKPIIIPALFFYYNSKKSKLNLWLIFFLIFSFIGDTIGILNFDDEIYYILFPFFITNLILIVLGWKMISKFNFSFFNLLSILLVFIMLSYLLYSIVDLFRLDDENIKKQIALYAFSVFLVCLIASYNLICKINIPNVYFMMCAICVIISDLFYIIYNFENQFFILNIFHLIAQFFSYFFIVKCILNRKVINKLTNVV